jgi:hypothetical protein
MKQTAVEWLIEQIYYTDVKITRELLKQAKEMEKEQMKYFIQVGYYAHSQGHKKNEELYNYWIDNYNK